MSSLLNQGERNSDSDGDTTDEDICSLDSLKLQIFKELGFNVAIDINNKSASTLNASTSQEYQFFKQYILYKRELEKTKREEIRRQNLIKTDQIIDKIIQHKLNPDLLKEVFQFENTKYSNTGTRHVDPTPKGEKRKNREGTNLLCSDDEKQETEYTHTNISVTNTSIASNVSAKEINRKGRKKVGINNSNKDKYISTTANTHHIDKKRKGSKSSQQKEIFESPQRYLQLNHHTTNNTPRRTQQYSQGSFPQMVLTTPSIYYQQQQPQTLIPQSQSIQQVYHPHTVPLAPQPHLQQNLTSPNAHKLPSVQYLQKQQQDMLFNNNSGGMLSGKTHRRTMSANNVPVMSTFTINSTANSIINPNLHTNKLNMSYHYYYQQQQQQQQQQPNPQLHPPPSISLHQHEGRSTADSSTLHSNISNDMDNINRNHSNNNIFGDTTTATGTEYDINPRRSISNNQRMKK
ncbi:uncharacterized protein SCDLUD_002801 [Saccharomycodes ludwigii]|uniref:uncharacterized protein n=1 Tax=Saccharomycodes ludwigii TaxID=36035 RepID=UPI001E89C4E9|nr:hypothetical protein SCDLUD_002801 [Saccharomycodes ludwigii]KAH3901310.1 hypothetical protein SCDLUD_002801 [Saccharomycodes ludwigii]